MTNFNLTRSALLICTGLILQSIRLFLPLPLPVTTFVIGILVHLSLLVTLKKGSLYGAILLSLLLPCTAYIQGQLALPLLIPVVMAGNVFYIDLYRRLETTRLRWLIPFAKAWCMACGLFVVLQFINLPNKAIKVLLYAMTVPQIITGFAGMFFAEQLLARFKNI